MTLLLDTHAFLWFALGDSKLARLHDVFMQRAIAGNGFGILAISLVHTAWLTTLPFHHRDPFDRLMVAQALVEQIPFVSDDPTLDRYGIRRIW